MKTLLIWKKLAFAAATALAILMLMEMLLWAVGVKPAYQKRDPYAGFTSQVPHFELEAGASGQELVSVVRSKRQALNPQRFPRHKPAGTYRIVCLGGSATYGRPFFDHTSFAGWLRAFLSEADNSRKWEVINAGAISYASYRVKSLMAELAQYEPDLYIAYMGHNEFLERRTYADVLATPGFLRDAAGLASRLRITTLTQSGLEGVGLLGRPGTTARATLGDELVTIPINSVGPEAYQRDEEFKRQVLAHYEASLGDMAAIAATAKARLLFVTPISNLRDFAPFKSQHRPGLTPAELQSWQENLGRGLALAQENRWPQALEAFDAALVIDDQHADLLYRKGQALLALGRDREATDLLVRARDEDICPLRALSATVETMRKVARERGVPLLDFERLATTRACHRITGEELLCDHVHLTIEGSKRLALDILDRLVADKTVNLAPGWGPASIASVSAQVEAGIDRPTYARELYRLSQLLETLGQPEQALKRAGEGLKMSGGDVEGLCLAGRYSKRLGKFTDAESFFRQALVKEPGVALAEEGLGDLLLHQGDPQAAVEHLEAAAHAAPASPSALNLLGVAHLRLGHHQRGIEVLVEASRLAPNEPNIHMNLARAEERLGHPEEAVSHYRETLRLRPDDPDAAKAMDRLTRKASRFTR